MNRDEAAKLADELEEQVRIVRGFAEGREVQFFSAAYNGWIDGDDLIFNFNNFKYRLKPTPTTRPMTIWEAMKFVAEHPGMVVRRKDSIRWLTGTLLDSGHNPDDWLYAENTGTEPTEWHEFVTEVSDD